jgi:hypothetical protein
VSRFGGGAGECPEPHAVRIDVHEIGDPVDGRARVRPKARQVVAKMLRRVVRGIADERLRVDHQPRLALRAQHVAGMEIGGEQRVVRGPVEQRIECVQARAHEARVRPLRSGRVRFLHPMRDHGRQRPEPVRSARDAPHAPEQGGDDRVLLDLRQDAQRRAGFAALQQQGVRGVVRFEEPYGWIATPEAQAVDLVCALEMRHADLEDGDLSVCASGRRHPGAADVCALERRVEPQSPAFRQFVDDMGKVVEPRAAVRNSSA